MREVYKNEFDSILPDASQANIVAVVEDNSVVAFLTSEVLLRVGLLWVHPKKRGKQGASLSKQLVRYTANSIPKGASVIAIASDSRFESLFTKCGMRKEDGAVYRIDL